jgi:hypothetical protein
VTVLAKNVAHFHAKQIPTGLIHENDFHVSVHGENRSGELVENLNSKVDIHAVHFYFLFVCHVKSLQQFDFCSAGLATYSNKNETATFASAEARVCCIMGSNNRVVSRLQLFGEKILLKTWTRGLRGNPENHTNWTNSLIRCP